MVVFLLAACSEAPEVLKQQGFALYDQKKFAEATPYLANAYKKGIDDPELVVRLAYCTATVSNDPTKSLEILQASATKYTDYARTYYEMGFIFKEYGPTENQLNIKQAVVFTRKAVQLDSAEYRFRDNLGMFFYQLGELDSADYWFREAKKLNANDPDLNTRIVQLNEVITSKAVEDSLAALDTLMLGK